MKMIALQVDEDIARMYSKITPEQRKRIESLFTILVQQELKNIPLMQIMDDIAEELITELGSSQQHLSQALELGLQELKARPQEGFSGFAEVLEFLANLPTPEEILLLRPSQTLQAQIDRLSAAYQNQTLTPQEQQLWQQYEYLEHIIRMVKAKAYLKLNVSTTT